MRKKKTALIVRESKPRNPLVALSLKRRAGAHGKTAKAIRQQTRQRTEQALTALIKGDKTEFEID